MESEGIRNETREPSCNCKTNRSYIFLLTYTVLLILFSEIFLSIFVYALRTEISNDAKSYQEKYDVILKELAELRNKLSKYGDNISEPIVKSRKTRGFTDSYGNIKRSYGDDVLQRPSQTMNYSKICEIVQRDCPPSRSRDGTYVSEPGSYDYNSSPFSSRIPGLPGPPGRPGSPGLPGSPGRPGEPGFDGLPGPPGPRGMPGISSSPGYYGYPRRMENRTFECCPQDAVVRGLTGLRGPIGPPGYPGIPGPPGPPGDPGTHCFCRNEEEPRNMYKGHYQYGDFGRYDTTSCLCKGTPGKPGVPGETGPSGPVGQMGLPGLTGMKGETGIPGEKGEKGDQGSKGEIGPAGPPGMKGDSGNLHTETTEKGIKRRSGTGFVPILKK